MSEPTRPDEPPVPPPELAELASSITALLDSRPQAVQTPFRAFVRVAGPGAGSRRMFSADTLRLVVAFDTRQADQRHVRQLAFLVAGLIALALVITGVLVSVYLVRDHVELVRAVLAGVGLLVSHVAAYGAGRYTASSRGRRRGNGRR